MLDSLLLMCHFEGFLLPSWRKIYCSRIEARLNNFLMTFLQGWVKNLNTFQIKMIESFHHPLEFLSYLSLYNSLNQKIDLSFVWHYLFIQSTFCCVSFSLSGEKLARQKVNLVFFSLNINQFHILPLSLSLCRKFIHQNSHRDSLILAKASIFVL